jgi:phosphate-selective porin OprO/OprP
MGSGLQNSTLNGAYVQASWFATGEYRAYKTKSGTFGRVSPKAPFDPSKGDWGAVEIAARYSFLDLNNNTIRGGEEQNFTAGVNWYLYSNLRLTLNYVYADVKDTGSTLFNDEMDIIRTGGASGSIHTIQARAQLEF